MIKPSLYELRWYASEAEAVSQFYRLCATSAPHVWNAVDATIVKARQHSFVGHVSQPRSPIERTTALFTPRYVMPRMSSLY